MRHETRGIIKYSRFLHYRNPLNHLEKNVNNERKRKTNLLSLGCKLNSGIIEKGTGSLSKRKLPKNMTKIQKTLKRLQLLLNPFMHNIKK